MPGFKPVDVYPALSLKGDRSLIHGEPVRAYVPHVLAVQAGSDLAIRNLSNVADILPMSENNGKDVHFMLGRPTILWWTC